ncbi:MAG: hypothetical protein EBV35_08750 [Betaproteobacteria bacterium]|nr:hypothetical protein [Betaproteobacteria bacterium]
MVACRLASGGHPPAAGAGAGSPGIGRARIGRGVAKDQGGIAAPSANRYGHVSPTAATHVREEFPRGIAVVLEGGDCEVGLESTIVALDRDPPRLLRPGAVGRAALEAVDYVVVVPHQAAVEAIELVRPHVYCKGLEYQDPANDVTGNIRQDVKELNSHNVKIKIIGSRDGLPDFSEIENDSAIGMETQNGVTFAVVICGTNFRVNLSV